MTVTVLDPTTALVAVDFQIATTSQQTAHDIAGIVANGAHLAAEFRSSGLPVVLTRGDLNHPPSGRTTYSRQRPEVPEAALGLVPAVGPEPGDILVTKRGWGPFAGTDLDAQLRDLGVTQVVIAGLATSFGIESTARQAYDLGYHVTVVADAITDPFVDRHDHTVSGVLPILGEVGTTAEILEHLHAI